MPLTTIYDGGTRIIGDATALEESLHPDVMAYVNAMRSPTGGNYAMTVNQIDAVNNMVKAMVANGIWSKMKAVYPIIGGTAAAHKYNLKDARDVDAAFRLTFSGTWTHSANGMTPTTAFANTFLNMNTLGGLNNNHLSFYSRTNIDEVSVDMGVFDITLNGGTGLDIETRISNTAYMLNNIALTQPLFSNTNSTGFYINSRTSSTLMNGYKNGVLSVTSTNSTTGTPNGNIYLGTRNRIGQSLINYSSKQCAFASIGDGLTAAEAKQFSLIVQAYQTKLGRQV